MTRPSFRSLSRSDLGIIALVLAVFGGGYIGGRATTAQYMAAFVREGDGALLNALHSTYGPSRHSQFAEEWIIRDYFQDARNGVFVDVGANHYRRFSNTYYLETHLGWSGVAIEPQEKFAAGYSQHRPGTIFVPLFVSDESNREATLYVTSEDLVASSSREFTESFGGTAAPVRATTTTLDDVLDRLGITRIDFLTMDIELAEPEALAGFSIERFKPRLVCIEAHPPVRQDILEYFARHGYVLLGKYWQADDENFWFAPLGTAPAQVTSGS